MFQPVIVSRLRPTRWPLPRGSTQCRSAANPRTTQPRVIYLHNPNWPQR